MLKTATLMALLSKIVYDDYDNINAKLLKLGLKDWYWFDTEGTQAMIIKTDKQLIVCFRGTEPTEISDVLSDLKAWPKRSREKGLVHFGFAQALDRVYDKMMEQISQLDTSKIEKVICTGHSLGAALATVMASRIDAEELYTFGSPRVGTRSFINEMTADGITHYRFVNNNDIVTRVPLALMGYKHHGELCYINHYGNIRKMTAWQRIKDQWRGRFRAWQKREWFDGARDHSMDLYYNKIKNVNLSS